METTPGRTKRRKGGGDPLIPSSNNDSCKVFASVCFNPPPPHDGWPLPHDRILDLPLDVLHSRRNRTTQGFLSWVLEWVQGPIQNSEDGGPTPHRGGT